MTRGARSIFSKRLALTVVTTVIAVGSAMVGVVSPAFGQTAPAPASPAPAPALPDLPGRAAVAASAPRVGPRAPAPRPRSLSEAADRAAAPGEMRPERAVAPQIKIPLGKTPPPPSRSEAAVVAKGRARSVGGVDDAAARCEAIDDDKQRAACRAAPAAKPAR